MAMHLLKIWPEHYREVEAGRKKAEFRIDDREPRYEVGDTLVLQAWDPTGGCHLDWPDLNRKVAHIARGGPIPQGWAMLSLSCGSEV